MANEQAKKRITEIVNHMSEDLTEIWTLAKELENDYGIRVCNADIFARQ